MNEVFVRIVSLPHGVREMMALDESGDYNIYISASLSKTEQIDAYYHALKHRHLGHFDGGNIQEIEFEAHNV